MENLYYTSTDKSQPNSLLLLLNFINSKIRSALSLLKEWRLNIHPLTRELSPQTHQFKVKRFRQIIFVFFLVNVWMKHKEEWMVFIMPKMETVFTKSTSLKTGQTIIKYKTFKYIEVLINLRSMSATELCFPIKICKAKTIWCCERKVRL